MGTRSRKLIAADESTVSAKSFLDPLVVEGSESNRCFPDSPCTDESDGFQVYSETDDLLDQLVPSEAVPRGRRRQFTNGHAVQM